MVSQSSDDAPTGPVGGQTVPPTTTAPPTVSQPTRRWNTVRDLTAAALLVVAPLLPWNLYFGFGIPGSNDRLFAVLLAVTLLSLVSLAVARLGPLRSRPALAGRLCAGLNAPYLLLVLAFVGFDVLETARAGGGVHVPGGVGPGAWLGVAGSLLSARPAITVAADGKFRSARIIGYASMLAAATSFGFNLYWRVKYALPAGQDFGKQNVAVIASAVVYGAVALVAVVLGSGWLLRATKASRLATVALGASTLAAGIIVWSLPVGRDIDAFHGIAQNTSTAGVGFEGYLAWAAAAAMFAPATLFGLSADRGAATEKNAWRAAARNGLLLITVWCLGSMLMRFTDLAVGVILNYPYSRYDTMVLAAFDLATAVLAIWLRVNLGNDAVSARLITSLCGLVATLSISRVVVGVVLAPRFQESPVAPNPVYGNNLAQQITSTFDVALCGLGLSILTAAIITGHLSRRLRRQKRAARQRPVKAAAPSAAPTTRFPVGGTAPPSAAATTRIPTAGAGSPRIFRGPEVPDSATRQMPAQQPRIFRPPQG